MIDLVEIGYIQKPHGYKGEVKVKFYDDIAIEPDEIDAIYIQKDEGPIPYFIETFEFIGPQNALIKFEEFDSKESALLFKSGKLLLPEDKIELLSDSENESNQYIGFTIKDVKQGDIGVVKDVYAFPHQDLLAIDYHNKEVLIPFIDELIEEIKPEQHIIIFNLPEGFLDI